MQFIILPFKRCKGFAKIRDDLQKYHEKATKIWWYSKPLDLTDLDLNDIEFNRLLLKFH